jgi:glycosyltransferase 2 family protein
MRHSTHATDAPKTISRRGVKRGMAGFGALTVIGLGILFVFTLPDDLSEVFRGLSTGFMVLAALAMIADSILGALRYHVFLWRIAPGTPFSLPLRADLVGRFTGAITPSQTGGGPGQVFVLAKGGVPVPDILSVLMINFVATLVFFLLVGSVAAWTLGDQFSGSAIRHLVQWGFVAFTGGVAFILVSVTRPDLLARPIDRLMRRLDGNPAEWACLTRRAGDTLVKSAERYKESCVRCIREWPLLPIVSLLLTVVLYLNKFTLAWFVMRGLGVEGSYTTTLAVQALLHFILYVAPTPGGSGIAELSTGALMATLMPTHLLGPFTLAHRLFLVYLPAAAGAGILAFTLRPASRILPNARKLTAVSFALAIMLPATRPVSLSAQASTLGAVTVVAVHPLHESGEPRTATYERRTLLIRRALEDGIRATSREDSLAAFSLAVDTAWALVSMAPDDPNSHYLYAVALGSRLELAGIREKIRLAAATRMAAETALALDPEHAGAHHVMGRLHAAAMRMSSVARWVARRLMGAEALERASWEQAEYHFRRACALEPGNPRHWMELGALYSDTGRRAEALSALKMAISTTQTGPGDSLAVERAIAILTTLECEACQG